MGHQAELARVQDLKSASERRLAEERERLENGHREELEKKEQEITKLDQRVAQGTQMIGETPTTLNVTMPLEVGKGGTTNIDPESFQKVILSVVKRICDGNVEIKVGDRVSHTDPQEGAKQYGDGKVTGIVDDENVTVLFDDPLVGEVTLVTKSLVRQEIVFGDLNTKVTLARKTCRRRLKEEIEATISFDGLPVKHSLLLQTLIESTEFTKELGSSLSADGCQVTVGTPVSEIVCSEVLWYKNRFIIALAAAAVLQLVACLCICNCKSSENAVDRNEGVTPRGSLMPDPEAPEPVVRPPVYSPRLVRRETTLPGTIRPSRLGS